MDPAVEKKVLPTTATPVAAQTSAAKESTIDVAIPVENVATAVVPTADPTVTASQDKQDAVRNTNTNETKKSSKMEDNDYMDEEEEPEEPEDEEEWNSEEEEPVKKKRSRRNHMSEDDDEEYGRSKKRRVIVVKKPIRARNVTANEPEGMKKLREYTSALKMGPRCFRGLNKISNVKDREAELVKRLHENGRKWIGEYPTYEDIQQAKDETRQKKAEKARQYIIEDETPDGGRATRKAAQKARDFVKTLGEEDGEGDKDDEDIEISNEDNRDDE